MENKDQKVRIVILAAGKGTRMKSELPKALMPLKNKHFIKHLLESVTHAGIDAKPIIVVGYERALVMKELGDAYEYVIQEPQLGTGHAVKSSKEACKDAKTIIVISADQPFIKPETIRKLFKQHVSSGAVLTIATTIVSDFEDWRRAFLPYGRIIRKNGKIIDKEIKDCTEEELRIREVNVSCYAFDAAWLWQNIEKLNPGSNAQGEYQLTDLWQIATETGKRVESIAMDPLEALGANSKEELEILETLVVQ